MDPSKNSRSLIVCKPDTLQRQIVGEILTRFERKGFKVVAMKMVHVDEKFAGKHYPYDKEELKKTGSRSIKFAKELDETPPAGTPLEIGERVRMRNIKYLSAGPVVVFVLEGVNVIEEVRKIVGSGNPANADVGTIRADFTPDSYKFGDLNNRTTRNLIHASDSDKNAKYEIDLWFDKADLVSYETAIEKVLYDNSWTE
ncbi:MAG TPA: nucleoside-diphosphate kinase [bacterium]|nr:nucleoside-diphosphate kinase [bacterium]